MSSRENGTSLRRIAERAVDAYSVGEDVDRRRRTGRSRGSRGRMTWNSAASRSAMRWRRGQVGARALPRALGEEARARSGKPRCEG